MTEPIELWLSSDGSVRAKGLSPSGLVRLHLSNGDYIDITRFSSHRVCVGSPPRGAHGGLKTKKEKT